ncbi:MAG TPA: pyruvate kinase [Flavobacteriales bacterium]|jgi:pyruvate kinase|nr:pyruvate kinase [Flavobacteriales bacterium]
MKRTKIVATMGPASNSEEQLEKLIQEGMNVARLNFSHGEHAVHGETIERVRRIDEKLGTYTAILADLQGPKLRIGELEEGSIELTKGAELLIRTGTEKGSEGCVYTNYTQFAQDVKPGEPVLMDDGKLELRVLETDGKSEVRCEVIHGGTLKPRKGINLPSTQISLPCITEKDTVDLAFALEHDVDWIGLSFVRNSADIKELRESINQAGKHSRIVAKIEKPEALADLDAILDETDAVMVARGDLGVEIPKQDVPLVQKDIIRKCMEKGKPVIVATQMMESMIEHSVPTRAEVNDVANAVLDGADAVMLSAETSVGAYSVEAVTAMADIIQSMERHDGMYYHERPPLSAEDDRFISDSMCYNACRLAKRVDAKAIVTMTFSGYTAVQVASQRPKAFVYMFTANKLVLSQMSLVWGVMAFPYLKMVSTDHTIADIKFELKKMGVVDSGDFVVHLASMPIADAGMTNMVKLSRV